MTIVRKYHAGDAVIYLKPRRQRGPDGDWYDRIQARYVGEQTWGRGTRHKIVWMEGTEWQRRYVHALSLQSQEQRSGDSHG